MKTTSTYDMVCTPEHVRTWLRDVIARIQITRHTELPNLLPNNWLKKQS